MMIADDFDAIRQRLRELTAAQELSSQVSRDVAVGQAVIEPYADAEGDVSGYYHFGGIVA